MQNADFDIIIPIYHPDETFRAQQEAIRRQSRQPCRQIHLQTVEDGAEEVNAAVETKDAADAVEAAASVLQLQIPKAGFNHGLTRSEGVKHSTARYFICMTQDAVPADGQLFENLLRPMLEDPRIRCCYARQIARPGEDPIEQITRQFNYPEESRTKTMADAEELGIKTFFCSDVCAAYDRETFLELGGFTETDFNEDMLYAAKLLKAGYAIRYCADAVVIHSHSLSGAEQFRRNKKLAVSQRQHPEVFAAFSSEAEGKRLVLTTASTLIKEGKWYLVPKLIWISGCKYLGFRAGKR